MTESFETIIAGMFPGRRSVSCAEVASGFGLSSSHVKNLCDAGSISAEPVPGRNPKSINYWRIPIPALVDFCQRRKQPAAILGA